MRALLTPNTVGGLIQDETVVSLHASLLGEHFLRNKAEFGVNPRAGLADSVARTCGRKILSALQTNARGASRQRGGSCHVVAPRLHASLLLTYRTQSRVSQNRLQIFAHFSFVEVRTKPPEQTTKGGLRNVQLPRNPSDRVAFQTLADVDHLGGKLGE